MVLGFGNFTGVITSSGPQLIGMELTFHGHYLRQIWREAFVFFQAAGKRSGNHAGGSSWVRGAAFRRAWNVPRCRAPGVAARAFWRYHGSDRAIAEVSVMLSRAAGKRLLTASLPKALFATGRRKTPTGGILFRNVIWRANIQEHAIARGTGQQSDRSHAG
jgi:hypothetical protein